MNITEDYVSFEVAKLLKEKGFDDEYTNAFYDKTGNLYFIDLLSDLSKHPNNDTDIAASTLYVAMKWLREVHKLYISLFSFDYQFDTYGWMFLIKPLRYVEGVGWCWDSDHVQEKKWSNDMKYNTYEDAVEAAIKYCLENLI